MIFAFASEMASSTMSIPVTSHPFIANIIALSPRPHPISKALPGLISPSFIRASKIGWG
jgi:hypothetical protein